MSLLGGRTTPSLGGTGVYGVRALARPDIGTHRLRGVRRRARFGGSGVTGIDGDATPIHALCRHVGRTLCKCVPAEPSGVMGSGGEMKLRSGRRLPRVETETDEGGEEGIPHAGHLPSRRQRVLYRDTRTAAGRTASCTRDPYQPPGSRGACFGRPARRGGLRGQSYPPLIRHRDRGGAVQGLRVLDVPVKASRRVDRADNGSNFPPFRPSSSRRVVRCINRASSSPIADIPLGFSPPSHPDTRRSSPSSIPSFFFVCFAFSPTTPQAPAPSRPCQAS